MCGIAGYYGNTLRTSSQVQAALKALQNRGPNHASFAHYNTESSQVYLLHTRLSIIDLDARSNQPYEDEEHCLVYNGEIYNYIEVREKLEKLGWQFKTCGDTEVLFYALKQWQQKAMTHLNGMWSFAFYHKKLQKLWLCRDRFGEKPLYYKKVGRDWVFASEVKAIEALTSEKEEVNYDQIMRYMVLGYKSLYKQGDTFFKNIQEVPRAHLIEILPGNKHDDECYWAPNLKVSDMNYDEAVEGFRHKLIHSVKTRMRTDVPLAFCLSGGVDSTALASIASKELGMEIQTYSIIDGDPRYNESDNIEATIKDLNCKNTLIHLNLKENHLDALENLIHYHDSPVATITYYIHSLLIREVAKDGIKVSISGTAADELVTGYYDHFLGFLAEMKDHPDYCHHLSAWKEHILPIIRNPLLQDPDLYVKNPQFREHIYFKQDVFSSYLKQGFHAEFTEGNYHSSILRNRMLNELFHEATPVILHEDDLNCMYYSVENRSPYLDHELMEFSYQIPQKHLMQDGRAKSILRDATKGTLNDQVRLDRRKRGFNAALHSLVDFQSPQSREKILDQSPIYDIVDRNKIEAAMNEKELPNSFSKFLFYFISSKLFLDQR